MSNLDTEYGQRLLTVNITGSDTFGVYRQAVTGKLQWWWSRLDGNDIDVEFDERGPFDSQIEAIADALKVLD